MSLFPVRAFCTIVASFLYGDESTSYVFSFRVVFFYLVTTGWILTSAYVIIQSIKATKFVSRDQILRRERAQGNAHFPCSADHEQDWQPYPVDQHSAICDDHTYIHTLLQYGTVQYLNYE